MDANLLTRFETALAGNQLDILVEELKAEGYSQVEVFDKFDQFRQWLAGREADEDKVLEMMDRIWGWCAPEQQLFSDSLTAEKIQAHRQQSRKGKEAALPEGWFYATAEEQKSLWQELKKELSEGHLLFNKSVQVLAHRVSEKISWKLKHDFLAFLTSFFRDKVETIFNSTCKNLLFLREFSWKKIR